MQDAYECLCLQCGLAHFLSPADLILEHPSDSDTPVATNVFCDQCGGVLGVLDAAADVEIDDDADPDAVWEG